MTILVRSLGLGLLLAGVAVAGWQEVDSVTNRDTSDITAQSNARSVACDAAGNIHVVWRGRLGARRQVWYSRYDAPSGHWSQNAALTNSPEGVCDPACVIGSSGDFYVSYEDSVSGVLHLLRRDTAGVWTELESLVGQQGDSMVSLASDDGGTIHAVWRGSDLAGSLVCYASHSDAGWSRPETLTATGTHGSWPSIACDSGGTVMAVWMSSTGYSILSRRRVGGGWIPPETVYDTDRCGDPSVSWGADSFYVAWLAGSQTRERAMIRSWSNSGWGDTAKVSTTFVGQAGVAIAAEADGALHVAWSGNDPGSPNVNQVQYRTRTPGDTWQRQLAFDTAFGDRQRISVAAAYGRVQVVWSEWPVPGGGGIPAVRLRRYERAHDVGVMRIEQPTGVLDSGAVIQPAAWVKNCGDFPESGVPVWFRLAGYLNLKTTGSLAPGDSVLIGFDSTTVVVRGWNAVACSTALAGDNNPANDTVRATFFVRVLDVAALRIDSPSVTVDSGVAVTPQASVRNLGTGTVSFPVMLRIGSEYADTKTVTALNPADSIRVSFANWTPAQRGTFAMRCSTGLAGDRIPANDTVGGSVTVRVCDVGTVCIVSPTGKPDSGTAATPACSVYNYGGQSETYKVRLRIGLYEDSATVSDHAAGTSRLVAFADWTATARGWQSVRCSTMLEGDRNPGSDVQSCSVFVRVCDAAPVEILCPVETISRGQVQPRVKLANRGNEVGSVPAWFRIFDGSGQEYIESVSVALDSGDSREIEFPPWQARSGEHTGVCWTALAGDRRPDNDTLSCEFRVAKIDAAVLAIRVPLDTISEGWVEPRVLVANYGDDPATFHAHFTCERQGSVVYHDSVFVGLDSSQQEVTFREWKAGPGDYRLLATVMLENDENPDNDSVSASVYVESLENKHWRERASVPRGPWGRKVRDGGCLVAVDGGLFALKGENTRECYRYSATADSWAALADMPLGVDGHKVKAGASLCWDGNSAVFALKGTGTHEFWRYEVPGDSWHQLASLPEHTRGVRYGSGLAFVPVEDTDKVFMVKGSNTRDFLVYWVRQNEWHARRPLPFGPDSTAARHGTCLALLGGRIFCLKGRTTEFYEYSADGDSWIERAALPRLGRGRQWKKPAKGAALASDGSRFLYAFKGGRCNEFWRYDSRGDSWSQLDDIPKGNHRRRVVHGGALAWLGGCAYALKGGGSNEFWCFDPLAVLAAAPEPERGAAAEAVVVQLPFARRAPVLLRCGRPAEYPVSDGTTAVVVIDAAGRVVARRAAAHSFVDLRLSRPGVYFVLAEGDSGLSVAKTMVVR